MTAGTTTRSIGDTRISLPRAGLGALLAGTLLAGGLLGAAAYAGINAATGSAAVDGAAIVVPQPHEPAAVMHLRIKAGNGPLVNDTPGASVGTARPDMSERDPLPGISGHAPGHGPLR